MDHLTASPERIDNLKIVTRPGCFETFHHDIEMARDSPLNLALLYATGTGGNLLEQVSEDVVPLRFPLLT